MQCEVIVVGAGIGGLATAALLAARGLDVCVFERQSQVGGCVANLEQAGYTFEPTAGLYSGWQTAGTYARLFSELRSAPPEVQALSPAYIVRLPDQIDVLLTEDFDEFAETLKLAFPECANAAVDFYRTLLRISVRDGNAGSAGDQLSATSLRFQRFIDVQLQTLIQRTSADCSLAEAATALKVPLNGMFAIRGGAQALGDVLASSFKEHGGTLRLNSAVLRLAYQADGSVTGVDLLSGERVTATRAVISNLTIWDTYGKLFGPSRTPPAIASQLKQLRAWGAYLLFASIDEQVAARLAATHFLVITDLRESLPYLADEMQFCFSVAPHWDRRAPQGQRAVTISTFADVDEWFSFHEDEAAHQGKDQAQLESLWARVHAAMPELGSGLEVIETFTPMTFYETTRRRFGMTGKPSSNSPGQASAGHATVLSKVFMIGDTVSTGFGLEGICLDAIDLVDQITA